MKKCFLFSLLIVLTVSCISTKSTIKNIDNNASLPGITKYNTFIITEISSDEKYGFDEDYPVNLGFMEVNASEGNIKRFFGALAGPNGEEIIYARQESCCPFPTKRNDMGAGMLDVYEVKWEGIKNPLILYINIYERGKIMAPKGFSIKKI